MNDIFADDRDKHVFSYLLCELNTFNIAYVHTGCFDDAISYPELDHKMMTEFLRANYLGTLIA